MEFLRKLALWFIEFIGFSMQKKEEEKPKEEEIPPEPEEDPIPADSLDPSKITWLDADIGQLPANAILDHVEIASDRKHIKWVGYRKSGPWYEECNFNKCPPGLEGTGVDGNLSVIAKVRGRWYGARIEWLKTAHGSGELKLEWEGDDPMFIQTKRSPLNKWKAPSGAEVYFVESSIVSGGMRPEPRGRSNIKGPYKLP